MKPESHSLDLSHLKTPNEASSLLLILKIYAQVLCIPVLFYFLESYWIVFIGTFWIGHKQSNLFNIHHEAAHFNLSKSKPLNRLLSYFFCLVPYLHHPELYSSVQWRRIHLLHHKHLMTDRDPNYLSRIQNGESEGQWPLHRYAFSIISSPFKNLIVFFVGKQDYVFPDGKRFIKSKYHHLRLLLPIQGDLEYNMELLKRILGYFSIIGAIFFANIEKEFLLFWIIPLYVTCPMYLRLMDILDHYWFDKSGELNKNTGSRKVNFFSATFIDGLNRLYHLEHHLYPNIPAINIPEAARILREKRPDLYYTNSNDHG